MGKNQTILKVPSLLVQLKRWMFFVLWEIAFTAFSIILIMGENVFWHLALVDNLYTLANTNEFDVWIFVWVANFVIGVSIMIFWNTGILGYLMRWIDNL